MSSLNFDSDGRFIGVNQRLKFESITESKDLELKTSKDLEFLKESVRLENIYDREYWSLYDGNSALKPLEFSNGKTQEDVVKEIVSLIKEGKKVILLRGVCGTGKSAIALNIARSLGKSAIVVPVKALQKQYEEDYMGRKYLLKKDGTKLKIAMITGRENHDSVIMPGKSCAYPFLPDTIKITEKNKEKLKEYFRDNPFTSSDAPLSLKYLRRISIAPSNPYWSPILPARIEINQLSDAKKRKYQGIDGEFIFYQRKQGCSYYDQYISYFDADVIIFNSAKYLAEVSLGRKPKSEVDIIDEADEFLDKFSNSVDINLTRLESSLRTIAPESESADFIINKIRQLISLEEANKRALGIDETEVFELNKTRIAEILRLIVSEPELEAEIQMDELNYANSVLEAADDFKDGGEIFLTYRKEDDFLYARLVSLNLARKFREISNGSKALVLMSGTLHSEAVLKHIYGMEEFVVVEAETLNQGSIEIRMTGKEFDCSYSSLKSESARKKYLVALTEAVEKSKKPTLVHVNAYKDLPAHDELASLNSNEIISREQLKLTQENDKNGDEVLRFKKGESDVLFTTKCSRGIDFPGEMCNSIVFTKYPNPNVQDTFWKILQKTHKEYYWEFYKDRAWREFLQRIYRAVRSKNDHVQILSPDTRVLDAVRELQNQNT